MGYIKRHLAPKVGRRNKSLAPKVERRNNNQETTTKHT